MNILLRFLQLLLISDVLIIAFECDRTNNKYDYNYYPEIQVPVINMNDNMIINSILFDESMKTYGVAVIDPGEHISLQQYFDMTYTAVKNFYDNTSIEYKNKFITNSGIGYFPFGHEKYGMKSKMLPEVTRDVMRNDVNYFNSTQILEPLEAFYIFNSYAHLIYTDHSIGNILGNTIHQNIPKEFYYESLRVFFEFHLIFIDIMKLASKSLGLHENYLLNHDKLLYNGYTHALKFAHYLPFGVIEHNNLSICDFPIRYDAHHDVGVTTLQKFVDVQRGFQVLLNDSWYNINANGSVNSMVVINGKHLEYWTNGRWKAAIHRVLSDTAARLPFLYFTQSDENTIIEPIKDCMVCNSNIPDAEYKNVFGRTTAQFIKKWQQKNLRKK